MRRHFSKIFIFFIGLTLFSHFTFAGSDTEIEITGSSGYVKASNPVTPAPGLRVYLKEDALRAVAINCDLNKLIVNLGTSPFGWTNQKLAFQSKELCLDLEKRVQNNSNRSNFILKYSPQSKSIVKFIEKKKTREDKAIAEASPILGSIDELVQFAAWKDVNLPLPEEEQDASLRYVRAVNNRTGKQLTAEQEKDLASKVIEAYSKAITAW